MSPNKALMCLLRACDCKPLIGCSTGLPAGRGGFRSGSHVGALFRFIVSLLLKRL